jgi:crossover junction endodeoxyribonuclease RuvC
MKACFASPLRRPERMPSYRSKSWRAYRPESLVTGAASPPAAPLRLRADACRILGLDPGSRRTGFGVIAVDGLDSRCLAQGHIEVEALPLAERLSRIHAGVTALIAQWRPTEVAIERVFLGRNVDSALKLGQARGAALAAIGGIELAEYAPRAVKLATVGFGAADKIQVAHMMRTLLKVEGSLSADAADALAVAMCHAQHRRLAPLQALRATTPRRAAVRTRAVRTEVSG